MPTTKTISQIGNTKFELVKDTSGLNTHDAFRFTVDDKTSNPNSPKTVMYISSEPTGSSAPTPLSSSGRVTMSNTRTEGATSTNSADVDGDIGIGGKILIREGTGTGTATRAAIYAEKDTTTSDNHRLIIDPYKEDDDDNSDSANSGTVYIRGNLIVEGDKTILDTAEHITSENLLGINAIRDTNGNTTGGAATVAGIHVYSGTSNTQFLYNFGTSRWRTAAASAGSLNDLEAKNIYIADLAATGTSTLTTVDINGGNIDGTAIGDETPNTAKFTTLEASGTSTLTTVDITGGNIDGTAIGSTSSSSAKFTTLDASGTTTLTTLTTTGNASVGGTLGVTGAATLASTLDVTGDLGVTGATTMTALTTTGNASVGGTLGVTGATTVSTLTSTGNASVGGTLGVTGATTVSTLTSTGNTSVGGTLGVTGAATLASTLDVTGDLGVTGATTMTTLTSTGNASVGGTLGVTGAATLASTLDVTGDLGVTGATTMTTLTSTGNASVGGTLGVTGATTMTTLTSTGNASVGGTLGVTGAATLASTLDVTGDLGVTGATTLTTLTTTGNASVGGTLDVTSALTAASGNFGTGSVTAGTFTGNLTGNVTGQVSSISNHSTSDLSEGTNLYYTDARARSAISLDTGETFLKYNNSTGKLSTDPAAHFLGGLGDVTLTSVAGSDILTYDASASKWVNSDSLTIKSTAGANFSNQTGSIVTEGGLVIKSTQALDISGASQETALVCMGGAYFADLTYSTKLSCGEEANLGPFTLSKRDSANSNPDQHSIIFTDNRSGDTTHRIFDVEYGTDTGGNANYKRNLGDDTIHVVSRGVSARTIGNIVPVELSSSGGRSSTKTISATVTTAPLHADILNYYSGKAFAAGKCVVALTNGTHSSVAMFSFSVCASVLTMVLDQEVHSSSAVLNVDYDSSGTIDLNLGTASSAVYCVKVLPIMTSDSITEQV